MDVKSDFLNGYIQDEVFVDQPPGFINPNFSDHVFKLMKALYGLKQAPTTWYDRLSKFLLENKFQRGQVDKTILIKKIEHDILLVKIYVDVIIFGGTNESLCNEFSEIMHNEFKFSMIGALKKFLGLKIHQTKKETFINQAKYCK